MKNNRSFGIFIILLINIIGLSLGFVAWLILKPYLYNNATDIILLFLISDVVATLFVWLMGVILKNSSVYDPYWSMLPMAATILFMVDEKIGNKNPLGIIVGVLIFIWGIRLTWNWAKTFKNLNTQDWRYSHYKNKYPKAWFVINLFGINLFPTMIVFLMMLGVMRYLEACNTVESINLVGMILAILLALFGIAIESIADIQMHRFLRVRKRNELINEGLWKRSRHPNYLGEICFWFGVALLALSLSTSKLFFLIGPFLNFAMFYFISIPLSENHQLAKNTKYNEYKATTNTLLIFPKKEVYQDTPNKKRK